MEGIEQVLDEMEANNELDKLQLQRIPGIAEIAGPNDHLALALQGYRKVPLPDPKSIRFVRKHYYDLRCDPARPLWAHQFNCSQCGRVFKKWEQECSDKTGMLL